MTGGSRVLVPCCDLSQPLSQPQLRLAQRPFPHNPRVSSGHREPAELSCPSHSRPHVQWPVHKKRPPFAQLGPFCTAAPSPAQCTQAAGSACTYTCVHTARPSPPEQHAQSSLASEQSRMSPSSAGPPSGSPVWAAVLSAHPGQAWAQATGAGFSPGTRCKLWQSFNGKVGCSDNATRVGARSCGGRGVRGGQGRAGSLKQQRTRTGGRWQRRALHDGAG